MFMKWLEGVLVPLEQVVVSTPWILQPNVVLDHGR